MSLIHLVVCLCGIVVALVARMIVVARKNAKQQAYDRRRHKELFNTQEQGVALAYDRGRHDQRREDLLNTWEKQLADACRRIDSLSEKSADLVREPLESAQKMVRNFRTSKVLNEQAVQEIVFLIELVCTMIDKPECYRFMKIE